MLDWKTGELKPYRCEEWWYDKKHQVWLPTVRGGAIKGGYEFGAFRFGLSNDAGGSITATNLALDSAYTFGSAGDAIASRCSVIESETLNSVYFRVVSYTGTAANVNDLNFQLRNETSGLPGSTLHTSATKDPASATGWIALTGLSFAMTAANSPYWAILGDADGNGTDFATLMRSVNLSLPEQIAFSQASQTTDGWGTQTLVVAPGSVLLVFASGRTLGCPFTASNVTSNTNKKGYVLGGFTTGVDLIGMMVAQDADYDRIEWWAGSAGPSGSATQTGTLRIFANTAATTVAGMVFAGGLQLAAGATGRLTVDSSVGGTTTLRRFNIGTGEDATLRSAMIGGGAFSYAEANGTTNWANDLVGSFPAGDLIFRDMVASGGGAVYHGAMAGGLLR